MRILKIATAAVLALLVLGVVLAPLGPLPGIFIGGTETTVPEAWFDTSAIHEIDLEVPGALRRVVTVWVIQLNGNLHVVGSKESVWVSMLGQSGPVRIRIGDKTYPMTANRMVAGWKPVLLAYQNKYRPDYPDIIGGFPPIEAAIKTTAVFRLVGR